MRTDDLTAAEIVLRHFQENPEPIPEGYELVTDGTTKEGDIISQTNTGAFVEKVIRIIRPKVPA